jgi:glyoxylase-like metal-dependent hydrolase (beta-lactamase superfamily II)/ketosteroid isomerase-like protein
MSLQSLSNSEIVAAYLDAVLRKDSSAVERFFHPEVEYIVNGTPERDVGMALPPISQECQEALPWMGLHQGRPAVKSFLECLHRNLEVTQYGPREVLSEGPRAAAFGWFRLHALPTGRTMDIAYSIFFELREGLIVKYHFLENTFDVASAFRSGGAWRLHREERIHEVPEPDKDGRNPMQKNPDVTAALSIEPFTSAEAGAWSNAYLISGKSDALLFDVVMLRSDARKLADQIERSGKILKMVLISHAHPDHFMGLDVIAERFPEARIVATQKVVEDIRQDGPWMFSLLQKKLGAEGPGRLIVPEPLSGNELSLEGSRLEIVEFGEGESRHIATLFIPSQRALLAADLIYHQAHCYLQEKHLDGWLARLDELENFSRDRVSTLHPGHGAAGDLSLIDHTRSYLREFSAALRGGTAKSVEAHILEKYPAHHARQFLTAFTLPAYFPEKRVEETTPGVKAR